MGCNAIVGRWQLSFSSASVDLLLGVLLYPEDGSDMFLRNVSISGNHTALQFRRLYSSDLYSRGAWFEYRPKQMFFVFLSLFKQEGITHVEVCRKIHRDYQNIRSWQLSDSFSIDNRCLLIRSCVRHVDTTCFRKQTSSGKKSGRRLKLTTHLHLVPRPRMVELYLHSNICLHGIVFN
jgi:hypothetical protein